MNECDIIQRSLFVGEAITREQQRHVASCEVCRACAAEVRQLEAVLDSAIRLPADKARLQQRLMRIPWQRSTGTGFYRRPVQVAASLLLVIGLLSVTFLQQGDSPPDSWQQVVYEHLLHEPEAFFVDEAVSPATVSALAGEFGMQLDTSLGEVNYITLCPIAGTRSLHMVFRGETGPVTVFYVPGQRTENLLQVSRGRFDGTIENTHGGVMAIVGEDGEPMDRIRHKVHQSLTWL